MNSLNRKEFLYQQKKSVSQQTSCLRITSYNVCYTKLLRLVSVGWMAVLSVKLTLFVFVMLPIAGWIIGQTGKSLKLKSGKVQSKMGDLLGIIEESLGGLRIIKAFNAEKKMTTRFSDEAENYRVIQNHLQRRFVMAHPVSEFLGTVEVTFNKKLG